MATVKLDKLKKMRVNNGWSQEQLASMAGVSLRTIQRIEKGAVTSLETAKSLASVFELKSYHLLTSLQEHKQTDAHQAREPFEYHGELDDGIPAWAIPPIALMSILFVIVGPSQSATWLKTVIANNLIELSCVAVAALITAIYKTSEQERIDNDPMLLAKQPPTFSLKKLSGWRRHSQDGIERYTSQYPVEKGSTIIGVESSGALIRHIHAPITNNMLFIGEEGSACLYATMGQLFPILCQHRSGLVLLNHYECVMTHSIAGILKAIGRENDILVKNTNELNNWSESDWLACHHSRQVVIGVIDGNLAACDDIIRTFTQAHADAEDPYKLQVHDASARPFIWSGFHHHKDVLPLLDDAREKAPISRITWLITATRARLFLDQADKAKLLNHFPQRFLLKVHDAQEAADIYDSLSASLYNINTDPLKVLKYDPGQATYFYGGRAWTDVQMTYVDYPLHEKAFEERAPYMENLG